MKWSSIAFLFSSALATPLESRAPRHCAKQVVRDSGFESGVTPPTSGNTPWNVTGFIGSSTYNLSSPGSNDNKPASKYAFSAILYPGPYSDGLSGEILSQTINTCVGQNYSILWDYKFSSPANNNCSLKVAYPFRGQVGSVTTASNIPGSQAGRWERSGSFFQATSHYSLITLTFACQNNERNVISVDDILVNTYNGNVF